MFRPGDEGEIRTRPYRPRDEPGKIRPLPYRPGDGNAREFLRPVAAGRSDPASGATDSGEKQKDTDTKVPKHDELPSEPGLDIDIRPEAQKEIDAIRANPDEVRHVNMREARRWAILNDYNVVFDVADNSAESGSAPFWRDRRIGYKTVREFDKVIEDQSAEFGVDPNLVRAVMYVENADGNPHSLGRLPELVGVANTILPMNINPALWSGMGDVDPEDFKDPELNIRAAVALIKEISERLPETDRTPAKIGSVWNSTAAEHVNEIGARIQRVYDEQPWEDKAFESKRRL